MTSSQIVGYSTDKVFRSIKLTIKSVTSRIARRQVRRIVYREDARLKSIWLKLRLEYFPNHPDLDLYLICWSRRRQRRVLASCNIKKHQVNVARQLAHELGERWLEPILYHEMCHAVLEDRVGYLGRGSRRAWHGKEFKELEKRHPSIDLLKEWMKSGGWRELGRLEK